MSIILLDGLAGTPTRTGDDMQVNVYTETGSEPELSNVDLWDVIAGGKDDPDTYNAARAELERTGRYWLRQEGLDTLLLMRA
jgi:hypothetical protein